MKSWPGYARLFLATALSLVASFAAAQSAVIVTGSGTANYGMVPVKSAAAESNHVLKAAPGNLYGLSVTSGATAGFVLLFNATAAPADGAVTPTHCYTLPAASSLGITWEVPAQFDTGITAVFSSGANCFTKTASATAFFAGAVK